MKILLTVFFITFQSVFVFSQSIQGVVYDEESKETLPFTSITVSSSKTVGTVSNKEGRFKIHENLFVDSDTIIFSYGGYATEKIPVKKLGKENKIFLHPSIIDLETVEISANAKSLTPKDIMKRIENNFEENYPKTLNKQTIFSHNYSITKFLDDDPLSLKKTNFEGLDRATIERVVDMMPKQFVDYNDMKFNYFQDDDESKIQPIQGLSLEESSMEKIGEQITDELDVFIKDIEKSLTEEDVYYKFKTGIISSKLDMEAEDTVDTQAIDSGFYRIPVKYINSSVKEINKEYASVEGDNWEFVTKPGKYKYEMEGANMLQDEVVYKISFTPKSGGLFQGTMYVSVDSYAILQLDFEYAEGKRGTNIHLFGIGYTENFKKGRVMFEKDESNKYYLKYIYKEEDLEFSVERNFSIMKKKKRFMMDKKLNEIKMTANIKMSSLTIQEALILNRSSITQSEFDSFSEPRKMKIIKKVSNDANFWENGTALVPTKELEEYKRQD
ncbi:carboxypeptidase-like regulatory domain-containing protein [Flammeovirga pectinis]|uniref:Carboxypeptidase-like regulatory domain-containing protein n=1 Tax=Flammeovirga pectinis TaxID=2494373 RepID=A0A3Q9FU39_9BACT|nr:carboxypeptidase-like regulatory domain-containing protein [Flammeovirga pectinis]AZQ65121.1 carboxypeptidase-like regulatory domain-containing protein [Flammeovirga pectinis]